MESLITNIFSSIIIMIWLICCIIFWIFYCVDINDIIFVWFHFLICMKCFNLSLVLIILEVYLIICLDLKFLMSFLLFSFFFILHHLLVVALLVNKQIFHQFLLYETILLYQFFCYCIRLSFTFKLEIIIIYFKNKFLSIIFTPHFISFSIWLFILFIKIDSYMIIHTLFSLVFFFKCLCAFSLLSLFKLLKNFIK